MDNIIKKLLITAIICLTMTSDIVLANGKIMDQIFIPEMLGENLAHFEKLTGPAKKTDKLFNTKTYIVEGCHVEVGYADKAISSLRLIVTPSCSFISESFLSNNKKKPTFGDFEGDFYADCLSLCGNAYDPSIYRVETIYPARYTGLPSYDIMVSSSNAGKTYDWAEAMIKKEGEDWVIDNKFNCHPKKYNDLASKLFKDDLIQEIRIGENLRFQEDCQ